MTHTVPSRMSALSAFALLTVPTPSLADSLRTPFNLQLSAPSTMALLSAIPQFKAPAGEFKTDLPDQNVTNPYNVAITGIHLTLDYAFNTPAPGTALNEWSISSQNITASILVDSLVASETIVEQSGGDTLTLQITATCKDIVLQLLPNSTQMSATADLSLSGGKPSLSLKDFSANWSPSAWQISSMNCDGPNGFSQMVQQGAAAELQSINPFLPAIQQAIQAQLASASSTQLSWTLQAPGNSGVSLTLEPNDLSISSTNEASLSGNVSFNFSRLSHSTCQNEIQDSPGLPEGTDSLTLPLSAAEGLLQCLYLNGSAAASFTSQSFSAFQSLLGNWFLKLFVWPDLERFGSQSIFGFEIFPSSAPSLGPVSADNSGNFIFNLSAPLTLAVSAPENSAMIPYVSLSTTLSGPAKLSIQNGTILFTQTSSKLNILPFWDLNYTNTYSPNEEIWTSVIAGYLQSYLSQTGLTYTIPTWQMPGAFEMSINSAVLNGSSIDVSLGIKTIASTAK